MKPARESARPATEAASETGPTGLRSWIRGTELGIAALAAVVGVLSGALAAAMRAAAGALHIALFGEDVSHGLSIARDIPAYKLLLVPVLGGVVLAALNAFIARRRPRSPIDPIEANALHGGRMSLWDGAVVAAQNIVSNGFGASVGLEAGYTQVGGGVASRLGRKLGLRRGDLRILVGCGAAGAISAAFDAPLTGAFYAFELVIGTYSIASLTPVVTSAVLAALVSRLLHGQIYVVQPDGIGSPGAYEYAVAILLSLLCAAGAIALMRGVTLVEIAMKRGIAHGWMRPVVGGAVVGCLALLSPTALSAGHGALHTAFNTEGAASGVLALLIIKAAASAVSLGAGFRGGLFFASLLLGALLGKAFAALPPELGFPAVDPLYMAVIGMSAFGTAVIGAPMAMTFMALETTSSLSVVGAVLMSVTLSGLVVRRSFGYSFATWRFHLRGETIRSAHDIGWLRDLSVGKLMRRDVRTVRDDTRLSAFRRDFPLGSTERVIALDQSGRYAGLVMVAEAHAPETQEETVAPLLRKSEWMLTPSMNAKEAMAAFDSAEAEALAVVDSPETRHVIGQLTATHVLRRYSEEVDKRRQEEVGIM